MDEKERRRIANALGAQRVHELNQSHIGGPLDLLALREEFNQRLRSTGGRPTDPQWTVSRQVPFKDVSWTRLQELATKVGASGRRVGPAQVAALLIENSLEELQQSEWESVLRLSRALPLRSQPEAAELAMVTYNQFDDWVQKGWLAPASHRAHERLYSPDEIVRAIWLRLLGQSSPVIESLGEQVRRIDLSHRYLVLTDGSAMHSVATRAQLYRLLESPGSHLVMDQFAERKRVFRLGEEGGGFGNNSVSQAI